MEDERIIELTDDEGGKERFIFLTSLEHDGRQFAVMTPEEPGEDEEEEAIVILEMLDSENGDEIELISVDDEELADTVFIKYIEMLDEDDEYDEDDEDDEDDADDDDDYDDEDDEDDR